MVWACLYSACVFREKSMRMTQVPANRVPRTGWAPAYVPPAARCAAELPVTLSTVGVIAAAPTHLNPCECG